MVLADCPLVLVKGHQKDKKKKKKEDDPALCCIDLNMKFSMLLFVLNSNFRRLILILNIIVKISFLGGDYPKLLTSDAEN